MVFKTARITRIMGKMDDLLDGHKFKIGFILACIGFAGW